MSKITDKKYIFAEMPVPKAIAKMAIPTIISQLINLVYSIVDTIFIGSVGNPYMVDATTLAFPIYLMTISFANLLGLGGGSLIARLIGRKQEEEAKKVSSFSLFYAFLVAALYSLIILVFLDPILNALGADSLDYIYAKQYTIFVVIIGSIPSIMSMVLAHLLRNTGRATASSLGLTIGGILNIILDPLFMFVLFEPGNEVMGAAVATVLSTTIGCLFLLIEFIKGSKSSPLKFKFRYIKEIKKESIKELFDIGIPAALLTAMIDVGNIVLQVLAKGHGNLALAAIGICMKAERIPNAINIGMCQGMLPMVAFNYAANNETRRREIVHKVRKYGLIISGICILLYTIFAEQVCNIFLSTQTGYVEDSTKTLEMAVLFLRIRCFNSPFQFLNFHSSNIMQGMGYGKGTLIHAITRILVFFIPLQLLFDYLWGMIGLASAFLVSEALSDIVAISLLNNFVKKNIQASN